MASAVIGALRVNLGIDTAEFWDGLSKAQRALGKVGDGMKSAGRDLSTFVSAPLAAMGALSIKTAGDFEASMNRVQAATSASSTDFATLQKMALDLGANTSKSASEAADMMEMLAKNGLTTSQILDGAAAASIRLSEATGGDLSTSADVATNVMAQFKIEARDLGRVVDGITNVTLASQFGFNDYKDALAQAGGVAGGLGVSLEDFNATIAATSSVFNSGADAGTSFKTFLTTLVPKSDAAAAKMEELGLEFFNANGSMKSMSAISEELKRALSGLSDEQKTNALTTIFGADAMRTAIALSDQGAVGFDKVAASIAREGSANEQAAARMKGFNGEMEKLTGALETLAITVANSGLLAFVTGIVSKLADLVSSLSETNPQLLKWGVVVAGVAAAVGPLLVTLGLVATGIAAVGAPVAAAVAGFAALAAAGLALYQNWDGVKERFPVLAGIFETLGAVVTTTATALGVQTGLIAQYLSQMLTGNLQSAGQTVAQIFANLGSLITNLANIVFPGAIEAIKAKAMEMADAFSRFKDSALASLQVIPEQAKQIAGDIIAAFAAVPGRMIEIGGQIIDGLVNGIKARWESAKSYVAGIGTSISESVKSTLGIHSPSRVMHEVGEFVAQGLANGIAAGAPEATRAAADAANGVSAALSSVGAAQGVDPWAGMRDATKGATDGLSSMESAGQSLASTLSGAFKSLIDGSKKLKDVVLDLVANLGSKLLDSGLNSIFGGLFGGGGGFQANTTLGAFLGAVPGFANGGSFQVGGAGGIDSQLVAFKASPNERVSITKPGQGRSGGFAPVYNIDARGSSMSEAEFKSILEQNNRKMMENVRGNVSGWVGDDRERYG